MLESLNQEQIAAVKQVKGPVIVFAGAGSGKTRTLTYRIAYMIKEKNIPPFTILAITFTNKATNEMKNRLNKLIGEDANGLTVSTFHSLFAKILRQEIHHLGYSRSFKIIDEVDQLSIISEVLRRLNLDGKIYNPKRLQKRITYCKSHNIKPQHPQDLQIYDAYELYMQSNNLLDFDDLLLKTYELFTSFPKVLSKYQQRYTYILVDEFQDTNMIQYNILKLLAEKSRNLFVVGDDDQSIYAFRGADYTNIKKFRIDFPDHKQFYLTQNYRSTQVILDGCNSLIKNNVNREDTELWSNNPGTNEDCIIRQLRNHLEEADFVVGEIVRLYKDCKSYNDFAIIYRSTPLLRNFELRLIQENIPYRIYGGVSYLRRKEIKDIVCYLSLIIDHNDIFSFKRIINVPRRGIGDKTLVEIDKLLLEEKDLFKTIEKVKDKISPARYRALADFKTMIEELSQKLDELSLVDFYDEVLDKTGYLQMLIEEEDTEERITNLMEFKSILHQLDNDGQIATSREKLQAAFDEAMLSEEQTPLHKDPKDAVTLTTVHSAKGLEFRYVFFVGLDEGVFPSYGSMDDDKVLEEERRVAYVGMTRAKEKLYLTSARERLLYGYTNIYRPSRFVLEFARGLKHFQNDWLDEEEKEGKTKEVEVKVKQTTIRNDTDYKVGDKILHKVYGEGTIVGINNQIGFVVFVKDQKVAKFDLTHPSITKLEKKGTN